MKWRSCQFSVFVFLVLLLFSSVSFADVREYELVIDYETVNFTGEDVQAMTVNGSIPGPTLRFTEGDTARIHVHNKMDVDTSIHWHGILVPPNMDGVPYISFPPIQPSTTFTYEFPICQSGTYWYHSHTSLQEQRGIYGSIVIEPRQKRLHADRDHVIVLSDWTDEDPHGVLRTLKRGSEWYAIEKGSGQSILGATRMGMLGDYLKRELQRMPPMDIADVAYDRFLANGKPESSLLAHPGETVRLRIIDGSATTYFHVEFAGGPMQIIGADGLDVEPVEQTRFLIGVAETYDVLVQVPDAGAYEFRATAHDGSGYASVWIGPGEPHPASGVPRPNLYHSMGGLSPSRIFAPTPPGVMGMSDSRVKAGAFDRPAMMHHGDHSKMKMDHMDHSSTVNTDHITHNHSARMEEHSSTTEDMQHVGHPVPMFSQAARIGKKYGTNFGVLAADVSSSKDLALDGMDPRRPWPPYDKLRSIRPTVFPADKPVREIRLTLDGDMERYVWFLNKKPLSETDCIRIRKGEIVRFIMVNRTMMHHPMHLHGHFFRVVNDQGDFAPLKHTVDVAPMSTTVIEFDANEFGDWFFHCHLLYHMKSGMARLVHYEGFDLDPELVGIRHNLYKDSWYFWGQADILSNMTEGFLTASDTRNILNAAWEVGWNEVDETEWEGILTWARYINRFFAVFAGADSLGVKDELDETRGVLGFHYLLPLNIESNAWIDTDGGARINLDKEFELTPRLTLFGEAEYDTHEMWEGSAGLNYTILESLSLIILWHSEYQWGAGVQIRF